MIRRIKQELPVMGFFAAFVCSASVLHAQSVDESWLRLSASACGAGMSLEASGDLEAVLFRRLQAIDSGAQGVFNLTDLERLLSQFDVESRQLEANNYRICLLQLMDLVVSGSNLPPREILLESPVSVSPLETIRRGQRFALAPGDSVALGDHSVIFSLTSIGDYNGLPYVDYSFTDLSRGDDFSGRRSQAELIEIRSECSLVPYQIDLQQLNVSFISSC